LGAIIVINLFLGWTFVGWVVAPALAVASTSRTPPPLYSYRRRPARGCTRLRHHRLAGAAAPWRVAARPAGSVRPANRLRCREGWSINDGSLASSRYGP
jgi:hypothetical protein